jgi:hypothetical protein
MGNRLVCLVFFGVGLLGSVRRLHTPTHTRLATTCSERNDNSSALMETQSQRDILNRSSGLQSDAKHILQYHLVALHARSRTPPCALPITWAQALNQLVDLRLAFGAFGFQGDRRAFTRVNGEGGGGGGAAGCGGWPGCFWLLCIVQSAPQCPKLDSPSPICYIV